MLINTVLTNQEDKMGLVNPLKKKKKKKASQKVSGQISRVGNCSEK